MCSFIIIALVEISKHIIPLHEDFYSDICLPLFERVDSDFFEERVVEKLGFFFFNFFFVYLEECMDYG